MIHPVRRLVTELGHTLHAVGSLLTVDDTRGTPPRRDPGAPAAMTRHLERTLTRRTDQLTAMRDQRDAAVAGYWRAHAPARGELVDQLVDVVERWAGSRPGEHVFLPRRLCLALACALAPVVADWIDATRTLEETSA